LPLPITLSHLACYDDDDDDDDDLEQPSLTRQEAHLHRVHASKGALYVVH
jgi:hypothetical protein